MNELVSVIIPTYNRAHCVSATIESALNQTYPHLEIIVIDDGSTDNTMEVLKTRWGTDPRVRAVSQPNGGVCLARNHGFALARGKYIALLDSDDLWHPHKIQVQVACINHYPNASMVHSEMAAIDVDDRIYDRTFLRTTYEGYKHFNISELYSDGPRALSEMVSSLPDDLAQTQVWYGDIFSHMLTGNLAHTSTLLFRRKPDGSLEQYDESIRAEETFDFHLRLAHQGPVVFIDAPLLLYRRGAQDHSWSPDAKMPPKIQLQENLRYLRIIQTYLDFRSPRIRLSPAILKRTLSDAHAWVAESALAVQNKSLALKHLMLSLRHRPWQPKRVVKMIFGLLLHRPH